MTTKRLSQPAVRLAFTPGSHWREAGAAFILLLIAVTVYAPSWRNGYIWDDDAYITDNVLMESLDGLRRIWFELGATPDYYPLTFTLIWVQHRIWDASRATGFHITSTLLHAANAIVLWRLLVRLGSPGAWLAAAIFVVHPVQVESVAWATECKTLLALLLGLASWHALLRFDPINSDPFAVPVFRWRWLVIAAVCFIAALLAKTVAVTLPPVMAIVFAWREGRASLRRLPWLGLLMVLSVPMCFAAFWTQHHIVGAYGAQFELSVAQKFLLAGRSSWFYLSKLCWPTNFIFIYPRWTISPVIWWQWLYPAAAVALVAILAALRRSLGWGPLAALMAYGVTLAPALGFFKIYWQVYSYVADHVQYAAAAAIFALVGASYAFWVRRVGARLPMIVAFLVLVALGTRAMAQSLVYRDRVTLWTATLEANPGAVMAQINLAVEYSKIGDHQAALALLMQALDSAPDDRDIYYNIGNELSALSQEDKAEGYYRRAIELDPRFPDSRTNLGKALVRLGDLPGAIEQMRIAVDLVPSNPNFQFNLGIALANAGHLNEAEARLSAAATILPYDEGVQGALQKVRAAIAQRKQKGPRDEHGIPVHEN